MFSGTTPAPPISDIELSDTSGKLQRLDQYIGKGKWVVLNWGPGCPPCRDEMPDLVRFHDKRAANEAMVVGIPVDFPSYGYADKNKVIEFADEYLIDFPLLLSDGSITEQLGLGVLEGLPTTYVFDPDGRVRWHAGRQHYRKNPRCFHRRKLCLIQSFRDAGTRRHFR